MSRKFRMAAGVLCAACVCLAAYLLLPPKAPPSGPPAAVPEAVSGAPMEASSDAPKPPEPAPASDPTANYPEGKLFITGERANYQSGDMTLTIPRLGISGMPVLGDVRDETLREGVGLYDYAQLPGEGNRNVSIAGHRDLYGCEFYYIDTLTEGDEIILDWNGKTFVYRYRDTRVVEEDDWGPIYIQGFSCVTLTSCTPIGVADHRIIVRGALESVS